MRAASLFLSFFQVGLFSVGGGYAAIPLIRQQAVERWGFISLAEFADLVTIAEMTPGPIALNAATFVGIRAAGLPGALAATAGCVLPSVILASALAFLYQRYAGLSLMQSMLACLRPAVVALIASAGLAILLQVIFGGEAVAPEHVQAVELLLFGAAFVLLRKAKLSPIFVMLLCGAVRAAVYALAGI
ncbi:MAG: chromate transporter [Clostridia bacterium]|nr:chromate transporter [Clostridia bacterium]